MDGWVDGWTDPSVVRAREVQERVGVVAEQAKKWQLPCKSERVPGLVVLWLCGSASRSCLLLLRAAVEVAFLFTPFPIGKQHSRSQDAFLWGRLQGGGRTPVALPFGMWVVLACMRWHIPPKIRFPHQPLTA